MKLSLKEEIRQVVQGPKAQKFATLAGLISVLSVVMLISGFWMGRQISSNTFGATQLYLIAVMLHGASCITIYRARKYHKLERFIEYRDWMMASVALGICNLFIQMEGYNLLNTSSLLKADFSIHTIMALLSIVLLFFYLLGLISLIRAVQRSFITTTYLEGFIEGLQVRFTFRQKRLWRYWVSCYLAILLFYGLCQWFL